jgi:Ser/Thr protein kinase RdoA (MazF antagonist)
MESADSAPPFNNLTPDLVLSAVESLGYASDARIYPLNSYENRVYQVGLEGRNKTPLIAKFYRPQRWSDEQILEEHAFCAELVELEVPVVPPIALAGETLFHYQGFRFSLYERRGGHAPELDNDDTLFTLGQYLGRIHALGQSRTFNRRATLSVARMGDESREFLLSQNFIPSSLRPAYETITAQLLTKVREEFARTPYTSLRLHGDCHPGNILWRDDKPNFVDLDDACNGPAIQDLWMLLSGDRQRRLVQLANVIEGYEMFCEFAPRELNLIESLRTLRLMHYAAWLARRWHDPAFPHHFPWFNSERYWSEHIQELREQLFALSEPPLALAPV